MPDDEWATHKAALEAAGLSPELILEHLRGLDGLGAGQRRRRRVVGRRACGAHSFLTSKNMNSTLWYDCT